jgi:hypothetical protein
VIAKAGPLLLKTLFASFGVMIPANFCSFTCPRVYGTLWRIPEPSRRPDRLHFSDTFAGPIRYNPFPTKYLPYGPAPNDGEFRPLTGPKREGPRAKERPRAVLVTRALHRQGMEGRGRYGTDMALLTVSIHGCPRNCRREDRTVWARSSLKEGRILPDPISCGNFGAAGLGTCRPARQTLEIRATHFRQQFVVLPSSMCAVMASTPGYRRGRYARRPRGWRTRGCRHRWTSS